MDKTVLSKIGQTVRIRMTLRSVPRPHPPTWTMKPRNESGNGTYIWEDDDGHGLFGDSVMRSLGHDQYQITLYVHVDNESLYGQYYCHVMNGIGKPIRAVFAVHLNGRTLEK